MSGSKGADSSSEWRSTGDRHPSRRSTLKEVEYTPSELFGIEALKAIMTWSTEPAEDLDAMFACLAHQRCRFVLAHFRETECESVALRELIDAVIERESPTPDRESVAISLHHIHLPKLADNDFITYDTDRSAVTITDRTTELLSQLSAIPRTEPAEVETEYRR